MRLIYLDSHPVPDSCTESLQIAQVVDGLARAGAQVVLLTPQPRSEASFEDVLGRKPSSGVVCRYLTEIRRRWWFPSSSTRPFAWMALRCLKKLPADAIVLRNLKLAEVVLKHSDIPVIFETHEIFAQTFREEHPEPGMATRAKLRRLEVREAFVYRHAAGLVALTQALADDIRAVHQIICPIAVAPDGVDFELASLAAPRQPSPCSVLLYLGSLHPWKGVPVLIHAMTEVSRSVLWIAGGSDETIAPLQELAKKLGVEEKINFLGHIPPRKRFDLINQADICLLPLTNTSIGSRYTSPLKLFEYMALGKPIVVADIPAMREVLSHGESAWLTTAEDPAAFAAAINHLLDDEDLRIRLGSTAAIVAKKYSWVVRAHTMLDLIKRTRLHRGGRASD